MLFNSINFAIFLPIVFLIYWFTNKLNFKLQNIILLISSYYFYGCWDWRFLFLLIFSTLLDYFTGLKMYEATGQKLKTFWFWLSISVNLSFLSIFKYYNFFITSFAEGLLHIGIQTNYSTLQVILPVGISFYTFHGLSYVIDIYKDRIKPERNFVNYSVFVCFFPLLVAGPIERATHLLPQITRKREFDYSTAVDGLRQILWGMFKKIVIADNCATYVNQVFNSYQTHTGSTLMLAAIFFAFQIYCDFSGYSDIALGTARIFGLELLRNFTYPYFSRDIAEFWRRWHISLTTWFRDYLYIPIGGSRGSKWQVIRNTFIIFIVSGFWHGANWTFLAWGAIHALLFLPLNLLGRNRYNTNIVAYGRLLPNFKELFQISSTFLLVVIAWVFFRASSIGQATDYISRLFKLDFFTIPYLKGQLGLIICILMMNLLEWIHREKKYGLDISYIKSRWIRFGYYYSTIGLILYFMGKEQTFIYFQF